MKNNLASPACRIITNMSLTYVKTLFDQGLISEEDMEEAIHNVMKIHLQGTYEDTVELGYLLAENLDKMIEHINDVLAEKIR